MPFEVIQREVKQWTFVTELRFAVVRVPDGIAGRLKLPPSLVQALDWTADVRLSVARGTGEDEGWYALTPVDEKHRARLRVQSNGVGKYTSSVLVPPNVDGPRKTWTPEARIEGNTLLVKLVP